MVIKGLSFPILRSEIQLLYSIPFLFQNNELHPISGVMYSLMLKMSDRETQEKSIPLLISSLQHCYTSHVIHSPTLNPIRFELRILSY